MVAGHGGPVKRRLVAYSPLRLRGYSDRKPSRTLARKCCLTKKKNLLRYGRRGIVCREGGVKLGFLIDGLFVGFETAEYRNDDGSVDIRHIVNVATGRNAYPVYMKDSFDLAKVSNLSLGSPIVVSCRVYAGKNGRITCVDGELV